MFDCDEPTAAERDSAGVAGRQPHGAAAIDYTLEIGQDFTN
jgi:hypothetical protein